MTIQGSNNKSVSTNTSSSTNNIKNIKISEIVNSNGKSITNVSNAALEEYNLDDSLIKESVIDKSSIDFTRIATSTSNVQNGKFITIKNTKYWGDNGDLTYKIRDDGTVAIMENGIVLGYTDLKGINQTTQGNNIEVLDVEPPKSNLVPGETTMVKDIEKKMIEEDNKSNQVKEETSPKYIASFENYKPLEFTEPTDPVEKAAYDKAKKMNQEVQDIFKRNGMEVTVIYDYRPLDSGIGYANDKSHHRKGGAIDIIPNNGDFIALRDFLLHNEEMRAYLESHNLGVIDETHQCVLEKTGGPTEHFHIGPDNMAKRMYKGWDYLETYCNDVNNAQSAEEIEALKQQMRDRLLSWEFREYEIQAFFEDAEEMLEN